LLHSAIVYGTANALYETLQAQGCFLPRRGISLVQAHVHHYTQHMDGSLFDSSLNDLDVLVSEYASLEQSAASPPSVDSLSAPTQRLQIIP
jgi:hypothetical protein